MNKPLITFIIPVGKCKEYLDEAIESVIKLLDYKIELEILIIIDNGVTAVESKFFNLGYVKCLNNNLGKSGPGISRNIGIEKALGDYISFLDSDDQIVASNFFKVFNKLIHSNNDLLEFDYETFGEKISIKNRQNEFKDYNLSDPSDLLLKGELRDEVLFQIYKKKLIKERCIKFPEGIYEDIFFRYMTLRYASSKDFVNLMAYKKRIHGKSITSKNKDILNLKEYLRQIIYLSNQFLGDEKVQISIKHRMIAFGGMLAENILDAKHDIKTHQELTLVFEEVCSYWNLFYLRLKKYNLSKREILIKKLLQKN